MSKVTFFEMAGVRFVIGKQAVLEAGNEISRLGCKKVLTIADQGITSRELHKDILNSLEKKGVRYCLFDKVPSDPPSSVIAEGVQTFKEEECDGVISIGGGSVMDAAKAINIMTRNEGEILDYDNSLGRKKFKNYGYPLIAIPTTSGTGSEITQYAVITSEKEKRKVTIGDTKLVSKTVILSPDMTEKLPKRLTASTGMDALAHAIEAYTSSRVITLDTPTVFSDTYALKAIEYIGRNLKQAYAQGEQLKARESVMLGATMAGFVTQAGSGAAHGMGTPLGSLFHVPHGEAVGMMLPYVMEYNLEACPERFLNIARAMGKDVDYTEQKDAAYQAVVAVKELLEATEFSKLRKFVPDKKAIEDLAKEAVKDKCCQLNARSIDIQTAQNLYEKAWNAS